MAFLISESISLSGVGVGFHYFVFCVLCSVLQKILSLGKNTHLLSNRSHLSRRKREGTPVEPCKNGKSW